MVYRSGTINLKTLAMKKIILSFALLLAAGTSVVLAAPRPEPGQRVLESFKKEFSSAENVSWNRLENFEKATFQLGGSWVVAYFSENGQLEGCARDIFYNQLPLTVMTAVDKKYADAEIINVREITNANGTHYLVSLEKNKRKLKVKVDAAGNITDVERLAR